MSYVVYVNHPTSKARAHNSICIYYIKRKAEKTYNGYWSKPFESFDEALSYANETGKAHIDTCSVCIK